VKMRIVVRGVDNIKYKKIRGRTTGGGYGGGFHYPRSPPRPVEGGSGGGSSRAGGKNGENRKQLSLPEKAKGSGIIFLFAKIKTPEKGGGMGRREKRT